MSAIIVNHSHRGIAVIISDCRNARAGDAIKVER